MQIFDILAPVFLLIAIGALLQKTKFLSEHFLKEANRVTYWLGLPALLFSQLAKSFQGGTGAGVMLVVMLLATSSVIVVAYLVAWITRVPGKSWGTFVQAGFRGNLAFVGLPIIYSLPDEQLVWGISARTAAVLTVAPTMVFYNTAGVVVLLLSQHTLSWKMVLPFLKKLATTPPLIATFAGMLCAVMGWNLPTAVDKTFFALGEMALPLGLLAVGGSLVTVKFHGAWRGPLTAALVKVGVSPLIGWAIGHAFRLGALEMKMILILLSCPTAVVSYSLAMEMKGDEGIASGSIVLSTVISLIALALTLWLF